MEVGAIAVRRVRKEDMRHIAKATGATLVYCYSTSVIIRTTLMKFTNSCAFWRLRIKDFAVT